MIKIHLVFTATYMPKVGVKGFITLGGSEVDLFHKIEYPPQPSPLNPLIQTSNKGERGGKKKDKIMFHWPFPESLPGLYSYSWHNPSPMHQPPCTRS